MEQRKYDVGELCKGLGWLPIHSRNPHMISFVQEETNRRVNIYYTRMTVTVEDENHKQHQHYDVTLEELELILTT